MLYRLSYAPRTIASIRHCSSNCFKRKIRKTPAHCPALKEYTSRRDWMSNGEQQWRYSQYGLAVTSSVRPRCEIVTLPATSLPRREMARVLWRSLWKWDFDGLVSSCYFRRPHQCQNLGFESLNLRFQLSDLSAQLNQHNFVLRQRLELGDVFRVEQ